MATILDGIRSTIRLMVSHLASIDTVDGPMQINTHQCQLLANKASETVLTLDEFEAFLQYRELNDESETPDWTPAATELHRVLRDAESLIKSCYCENQWLKVAICQGDLKETFGEFLNEIEWHMSVLCSFSMAKGEIFETMLRYEGELRITDYFSLQATAKYDLEFLRSLLRGPHDCGDEDVCKSGDGDCLVIKLLKKLDAEERELLNLSKPLESNSPLFLWVRPKHLRDGSQGRAELGRGSFARVKETKWLGQTFAWKVFSSGRELKEAYMQEMAVMAGLNHPHVVRVVCCSEDAHDTGIVMELMYKSLYDLLQDFQRREHPFAPDAATPFSIIQSVGLMLQIAKGMRYIHSKGFAHRDLKSPNILVQFADHQTGPFIAKVSDFGLTKIKNDSTAYGAHTLNTGTRKWMAPEVWMIHNLHEPAPSARFHPKKMDVYGFGIVCCEILSGEEPYQGVNLSYPDVRAGRRPDLPTGIPERLTALIQQCWDGNSRLRPDFPAICTQLRFIKALLLRGDDSALQYSKPDTRCNFNGETRVITCGSDGMTGVEVQGPWGGEGGGVFFDGIVTSIKQIKLKYDSVLMRIWYIEMEYEVNGISFFIGHGDGNVNRQVRNTETIEIDEANEHLTKIEGSYCLSPQSYPIKSVSSLTIHTNKKIYGPFGGVPEDATLFQSKFGRIVGFHGRCGLELDAIGCFIISEED